MYEIVPDKCTVLEVIKNKYSVSIFDEQFANWLNYTIQYLYSTGTYRYRYKYDTGKAYCTKEFRYILGSSTMALWRCGIRTVPVT